MGQTAMTIEEMQQITLNHWRKTFPAMVKRVSPTTLLSESLASAKLTRLEMDTLMQGTGLSAQEAWAEARTLFCLTAQEPKIGR